MVPRTHSAFPLQRFVPADRESRKSCADTRKWEEKTVQMACYVTDKEVWDGAGTLGIDGLATTKARELLAKVVAGVGYV